ncbi:PREDICTED: uncharacterized protein LOC109583028 isoform X2 [Amphimedon queenslandica]|uniref:RAMA domain-containing protein n=1 Tax=Amphimedon queenslandica TaxID=400682 RepID=A0AAN0JAH2_AMPQE|nr:PREDICTED: uncharacterized protein LOC109583028 isoform X2 [Amphimedon queenslandica]|eukprot:XP_019853752.1 PREDICTED: uncharacterized protein LOC109583028 isoform X2 [Amphimedon queenslandica]
MMSQDSDETMILDGSCSPSLLSQGRSLFYQEEDEEEAYHHQPLPLPPQEQLEEEQNCGCHGNDNVLHEEGADSSLLAWIQKEQENIERQFFQTDQLISVPVLEKTLRDIEGSLKKVSVSNQKERKELASFCNTSSAANRGDIKKKLISLTSRQKTLLYCFKKQTTLSDQLKQVKSNTDSAVAMETNNPPIEDTGVAMETTNPVVESVAANPVLVSTARAGVRLKPQSVPGAASLSQSEGSSSFSSNSEASLSQPVPLDALIRQGFLTIRDKLTCNLMGCTFEASITSDGQLVDSSNGGRYPSPQSWQNACWSVLGHQKRVKKMAAYKTVYCRNQSLSSVCESYSLRQKDASQQYQLTN